MSRCEGLPRLSILAPTPIDRPSLVIRPWHQAANVVSLREFSNTAFNHHHGIQTTERFGKDTDLGWRRVHQRDDPRRRDRGVGVPGDAAGAGPGDSARPRGGRSRARSASGVSREVGCARCHVPELPLTRAGWIYTDRIRTTRRPTCGPAIARPLQST